MIIIQEVIKNLRIIIRDRTSAGLLLIGPIIIILMTGFLFGQGLSVKHLKLGIYIQSGSEFVNEMLVSLNKAGSIITYASLEDCVDNLRREKIHLCLDVKQDNKAEDQPHATVHLYSNITGSKMWAGSIVPEVQFLIEANSYQISVASTENFLDLIQNLNTKLRERQASLREFLGQLNNSNKILQRNKEALANFQYNYRVNVKKIDSAKLSLSKQSGMITSSIDTLSKQIDALEQATDSLKSAISVFSGTEQKSLGILSSILSIPGKLDSTQDAALNEALPFTLTLDNVQSTLDLLQKDSHNLKADFLQLESSVTNTASSIDDFTKLLEHEAAAEYAMIAQIDSTAEVLQSINSELDSDLSKLSVFEGALAENIIRPILQEHSPIGNFRTIEILFSIIMIMLLTFIATIFANIISLEEINSSAHFRNIISPTPNSLFMIGAVITNCLLVGIQIATFFLVAQFQFKVDIFRNIGQLIVITFLHTVIFTMVGITTAYLIKKQQLSILVSVFIALGLFIFSNAFYPLELMPELGASIAAFNPVGITETLSRLLILYDVPITDTSFNLAALCGLAITTLLLALYANHRYVEKLK